MTTPITKEQLIARIETQKETALKHPECSVALMDLEIARIAQASLEAEAVAECHHQWKFGGANKHQRQKQCVKCGCIELSAPPAPVTGTASTFQFDAARFLPECLKPEEISGNARSSRIAELMGWFDRYYSGKANPKWLKPHTAELCYYILTAAPVPVVPKILPCAVELKPGIIIGKGCKTETLLTALQRRADYHAEIDAMTPEERAERNAGMRGFAAMLNGDKS